MNLIFGCGYLGERAAALWQQAGEQVAAVSRSANRAEELRATGLTPVVADVTVRTSLNNLPAADVVVWAVGRDRGQDMREVYVNGLANALDALSVSPPRRFVYISSTSVHGEADGERITEESSCTPDRENGRICLEAESLLRKSPLAERAIILRLAGIYGPGRLPNLQKLIAGERLTAEPEHRLNLIHVDDAAQACVAAAGHNVSSPDLFLVSDGNPPTRREFYSEAARLWQTQEPEFRVEVDAEASRGRTSDKRIDSSKLQCELLTEFAYPDYVAGLRAIRHAEGRD